MKDPPKELESSDAQEEWIQQNKLKISLGRFAPRNLQKEYEEVVPELQRAKISFNDMIKCLKTRFKKANNTTLANFEFHKIYQHEEESFDAFTVRVKHEANNCDFTRDNPDCSVKDTLARDQIIIGTTNDEIRRHALKNQWNLSDLIQNGRQLEAAARGANRIKREEVASANVNRTKRPGKYSKKWKPKGKKDFVGNKQLNKLSTYKSKSMCSTSSFEFCKGGKRCPGSKVQCFDCQKYGHFRGSVICTGKKNKKSTRRIDSDSKIS